MLGHAHTSPTRFRNAQPKEGNERSEGQDNFGPTHVAPGDHLAPQPAVAGPDAGGAGKWAGRGGAQLHGLEGARPSRLPPAGPYLRAPGWSVQ